MVWQSCRVEAWTGESRTGLAVLVGSVYAWCVPLRWGKVWQSRFGMFGSCEERRDLARQLWRVVVCFGKASLRKAWHGFGSLGGVR